MNRVFPRFVIGLPWIFLMAFALRMKADEAHFIDLRQGFGEAKWGMSPAELKEKLPGVEDVSRLLPSRKFPHLEKMPKLLRLDGKATVVDTLYLFQQDHLVLIVRSFDEGLVERRFDMLTKALNEQFLKPEPKAPEKENLVPVQGPVMVAQPTWVPGPSGLPVSSNSRIHLGGTVATLLDPSLGHNSQSPSFPGDNERELITAGQSEGIVATLRFSSNKSQNFHNVALPNGVPPIQLWMENQALMEKLDLEEARQLAREMVSP